MTEHRTVTPSLVVFALLIAPAASYAAGPEISADLRVRSESNLDAPGKDNHHRGRLRARVAIAGGPADWVDVGVRATTGNPDDPNSQHVNMTDNLNSFPLSMDRIYLRLKPLKGLSVWGGKFSHPAKVREVVWDGDVQPQGAAASWQFALGGALQSVTPTAFYYLINNPDPDNVATVSGGQVRVAVDAGSVTVDFATGVIVFSDIDSLAGESPGNRIEAVTNDAGDEIGGTFASDFQLIDTTADIGFEVGGLPVKLSADVVLNTGADDDNLGWWAGATLGQRKSPGDWMVKYHLSDVAQDSVVSAMAQDDFRLSTGYQGHDVQFGVRVADGFNLTAKAYLFKSKAGDVDGTDPDEGQMQTRARVDVDMRF